VVFVTITISWRKLPIVIIEKNNVKVIFVCVWSQKC
jgi:hypothetical protein